MSSLRAGWATSAVFFGVGFVAAAAMGLVLWATARGPGMSPDSVTYAYAGKSFAASGRLSFVAGGALTIFPPGLPVLLGVLALVGIPVQTAGIAIGVLSVVAVIVMTYLAGNLVVGSRLAGALAAGIVGLSAATLAVYSMLWTEPLFNALVLGVLVVLAHGARSRSLNLRAAVTVVLGASAATMLRDVGVTLVPAIAVAVLLIYRASGWRAATARAAAVSVASCAGLAFVAIRNHLHGAGPLGPRYPSSVSFASAIKETLKPLGSYLVAGHLSDHLSGFGAVLAALAVIGVGTAIRRHDEPMAVIATFAVSYWLLLWYSEATTAIDPIDPRLASPAMAPTILLATYAVTANLKEVRQGALRHAALACFGAIAVVVMAVSAVADVKTARRDANQGIEYNSIVTLGSPLGQAVERLPGHAGLASNNPKILYWVTGHGPVAQIPATGYYFPPAESAAELRTLRSEIADGSVSYLAYFTGGNPALQPPRLGQVGIRCTITLTVPDGTLWHCN